MFLDDKEEEQYMSLKFRIEMWVDNLRARCQRFIRGYSYGDIWDMDYWFMRTVKPMLIHLRDYGHGVPMEFENNADGWRDVLTEMTNCITLMDEDEAYRSIGADPYGDRLPTKEEYEMVYKTMEDNKNRFFELFSKYFYDLWD